MYRPASIWKANNAKTRARLRANLAMRGIEIGRVDKRWNNEGDQRKKNGTKDTRSRKDSNEKWVVAKKMSAEVL